MIDVVMQVAVQRCGSHRGGVAWQSESFSTVRLVSRYV
jgi:hypothetical protein